MVWNLALLLVVFKWHHGSEGVKIVFIFYMTLKKMGMCEAQTGLSGQPECI